MFHDAKQVLSRLSSGFQLESPKERIAPLEARPDVCAVHAGSEAPFRTHYSGFYKAVLCAFPIGLSV